MEADSWVGPHRALASLARTATGASLRPAQAAPEGPANRDGERVRVDLFVAVALAVAATAMLLVGGCAMPALLARTESPTPTEAPTEMPTETLTATETPLPPPQPESVSPDHATAGQGGVDLHINGRDFRGEPYVFLTHPSYGEIEATDVKGYPGGWKVECHFDMSGAEAGVWGIEVINLDGTRGELPDAFEIVAPTATSTPSPTPTATTTPTPTATIVIVRATETPIPPTATPTTEPSDKGGGSRPEIDPPPPEPP